MVIPGLSRARTICALFLFLLSYIFFFQIYPNFLSTNEYSRFLLTSAIVDFQTLQIDKPILAFGNSQDKAFYNGHYYSDKAIGLSLTGVPVYAVLKLMAGTFHLKITLRWVLFFLKLFCVTIPTLFFVTVLSKFWTEIRDDRQAAALSTYLFLFGTIAFTYSVQFVSNSPAGCLLFLSFYYIHRGNKEPSNTQKYYALAGIWGGMATLYEYPAFLLIPPLAGYLLWTAASRFRLSWFVVGFVPFFFILLAYNYAIFGTPFDVTYHHMSDVTHVHEHSQGFLGFGIPRMDVLWKLLFSSSRGLFYFCPVLLLSVPGFYFFYKTENWKKEAVLFLSIILILFIFVSGMSNWPGGWAFGPRYLAPAMPFLMTGVFCALSDSRFRSGSKLYFLGIILSLLSVLIVTVGTITFPFPAPEMTDPLFTLSLPLFLHGDFSLNLASLFGLSSLGAAILFFIILVVTLLIILKGKKSLKFQTKDMLLWAGAVVIVIGCFLMGSFLAKPTAFDYYARASVCVYLGDYSNALNNLKEALKGNPESNLKRLISLRYQQILELSSPVRTVPH
jgi:Dolichyl-phosphate-mannose-protein mannosyltransferase